MKIYTKTGDKGDTSLYGGKRVSKDAPRIETYGLLDELNASLGFVRSLASQSLAEPPFGDIERIQHELFQLGAEMATPHDKKCPIEPVSISHIEYLEKAIDRMESELPVLKNFILPGGAQAGAALHLARSVCRRAERALVSFRSGGEDVRPEVIQYLNRLSDYLFVAARFVNLKAGVPETLWKSK